MWADPAEVPALMALAVALLGVSDQGSARSPSERRKPALLRDFDN